MSQRKPRLSVRRGITRYYYLTPCYPPPDAQSGLALGEIQTPPTDPANRQAAFVPGQHSTVYPQMPTGLVYPGDLGVPRGHRATQLRPSRSAIGFCLGSVWGWEDIRPRRVRRLLGNGVGQWLEPAIQFRAVHRQPLVPQRQQRHRRHSFRPLPALSRRQSISLHRRVHHRKQRQDYRAQL